jgi:hypothetical protein
MTGTTDGGRMTNTPDPGPTDVEGRVPPPYDGRSESAEPAGGAPSGDPGPASVGPAHHLGTPRGEDADEEDLEEYGGES